MDIYTTAFDFPRPPVRVSVVGNTPSSNTTTQLPGSSSSRDTPLPNTSGSNGQAGAGASASNGASASSTNPSHVTTSQADEEWREVQAKCLELTTRHGCLVTATREGVGMEQGSVPQVFNSDGEASRPIVETPIYNYHLSGAYATVMTARGHLLREAPRETSLTIKVSRSDILESPLADISPVKSDVLARLMPIALEAQARLSVINVATQGATVGAGAVLATAEGINPGETEEAWDKGQDWTTQAPGHDRTSSADSSITDSIKSGSAHGYAKAKARAKAAAALASTSTAPAPTPTPNEESSSATVKPPSEADQDTGVKSDSPRTYGLETERLCEILITGPLENVYFANLKCLVMLDELVSVDHTPSLATVQKLAS